MGKLVDMKLPSAKLQAAILFVVLVISGGGFQYYLYKEDIGVLKKRTRYLFKVEEERMRQYLKSYSEVLFEYRKKFEGEETFSPSEFNRVAKRFLLHFPDTRAFNFLNKNMIISQVYPAKGNSAALGKNLLNHPDNVVRDVIVRGLSRDVITFIPPVNIYQGGSAIIFYMPISFNSMEHGWFNVVILAKNLFKNYRNGLGFLDFDFSVLDNETGRFFIEPKVGTERHPEHLLVFPSTLLGRELTFTFNLHEEFTIQQKQSLQEFMVLFIVITLLSILFFLYSKSRDEIYRRYIDIQNESNLLKVLVHDLSNPVQVVLLGLSNLKAKATVDSPMLDTVVQNQKVASEVIETVRDIYKGHVFYQQPYPSNLVEMVEEILLTQQESLEANGIEVSIEGEASVRLPLDPKAFKNHVLKNLISNAIKFSERSSTLEIFLSEHEVVVSNSFEVLDPQRFQILNEIKPQESTLDNQKQASLGLGLFIAKLFLNRAGCELEIWQDPQTKRVYSRISINRA